MYVRDCVLANLHYMNYPNPINKKTSSACLFLHFPLIESFFLKSLVLAGSKEHVIAIAISTIRGSYRVTDPQSTSGPDLDLVVRIRIIKYSRSEFRSASVPALPSANIGELPPALQKEERIRVESSPTKGQKARISFTTFSTISYNIIKKDSPAHFCKMRELQILV